MYFRIPADDEMGIGDFMRLRAALANPQMRELISERYTNRYEENSVSKVKMKDGISKTLTAFSNGGLEALGQQIERGAPQAERDKIAASIVRLLEGALWDGLQLARAQENLPERAWDERHQKFIRMALYSLSEYRHFESPVLVELSGMDIKQATGLQGTRSPGQWWVYLGSIMLVLGTLAMAFIRESRIWLHITPNGERYRVTMAMSSTRRTYDFIQNWERMSAEVQQAVDGRITS